MNNQNDVLKTQRYRIDLPVPSVTEYTPSELRFKKYISIFSTILIFSSHLDDAVLSMGSLLAYLGSLNKNIEVINIFTEGSVYQSSFNIKLLQQAKTLTAVNYFQLRRNEDKKAIETFGKIHIKNLGLIDAAWRTDTDNNLFYAQSIIGDIKLEDKEIIKKLESILSNIKCDSNNTLIFAPLARGRHVDHQIVRNSVLNVFKNIVYYCDFPYSHKYKNEDQFITDHGLSEIEWHGSYSSKKKAILKYKSQKISLFHPHIMQLVYEVFYLKL